MAGWPGALRRRRMHEAQIERTTPATQGAQAVVSSLAEARVAARRLTPSSARPSPSATGATPAESTPAGWADLEPVVTEVP